MEEPPELIASDLAAPAQSGAGKGDGAQHEKDHCRAGNESPDAAHFAAFALLLLAVVWPLWFVYPAGLTVLVASGGLLRNLLSALSVHREHRLKIESQIRADA